MSMKISTQEESIKYGSLLLELNRSREDLNRYYKSLNEMMQMANFNFGKRIPEQSKKEIYHYYHAGRYNQNELANQYGVAQGTINKIVNGNSPELRNK